MQCIRFHACVSAADIMKNVNKVQYEELTEKQIADARKRRARWGRNTLTGPNNALCTFCDIPPSAWLSCMKQKPTQVDGLL